MKPNKFIVNKKEIVILLIVILGVLLYSSVILYLPLFGDATIHANIASQVISEGISSFSGTYPALYIYVMNTYFQFFGEKGYNLVVLCGVGLILISSFLYIRKVTKTYWLGLLGLIVILLSTKLIFYSGRLYMEVLLSGFFIITLSYLYKIYSGSKKIKNFLILGILCGACIGIKQQGLFIFFPFITLCVLYLIYYSKFNYKENIYYFLSYFIPIIIFSIPTYGLLFHTSGEIVPGSNEFFILKTINGFGNKIFNYKGNTNNELSINKYEGIIKQVRYEKYQVGHSRADRRATRFLETFMSFSKFNGIHNLYSKSSYAYHVLFLLSLLGIIYLIKFKKIEVYIPLIVFLIFNYALFSKNSDQSRYHMFIPYVYIILSLFGIYYFNKKIKFKIYFKYFIGVVFILILFINGFSNINKARNLKNSQIYSPSIGGIDSIKDIGNWLLNNTDSNDKIFQTCGNETKYYSNRNVSGSRPIYFFNKNNLKSYLIDKNYKYVVIYKSQLKSDGSWINFCWIPESFNNRVIDLYDIAYTSLEKDIFIYRVK